MLKKPKNDWNETRILLVFSDVNASPQLLSILKRLKSEQISLKVFLIGDDRLQIAKDMSKEGIDFRVLKRKSKYSSFGLFWAIFLELVKGRPAALYASGQFASVVGISCSFLLGIPMRVFTRHHSNFHHKYNMKFGVFVDRLTNTLATNVIAVSKVVQEILVHDESVRQNKISLIPNGIDLAVFRNTRLNRKEHSSIPAESRDELKVGIISRMTNWKGIEYAAKAFVQFQQQYPKAHLCIIGTFSDSYADILEILKPLPKANYTLEEFRSDIAQFLYGLDIFVHVPIGFRDEAFGIVYIEALAGGTPSIVTLSGVLHELPELKNYVEIVPYMDSDSIFAAMLRIVNQVGAAKPLVPEQWLQQYSLDGMASQYSELLLKGAD